MDGFNTFEKQDKVLLGLNSGSDAAAAMRILRQQGFAVQTFTAEHEVTPAGLLQLLADKAAELDCTFIATGHYARIEVDGEGLSHLLPAADARQTRVPRWQVCRRKCWLSWCCRWASLPRQKWRRCWRIRRNKSYDSKNACAGLKPAQAFLFALASPTGEAVSGSDH